MENISSKKQLGNQLQLLAHVLVVSIILLFFLYFTSRNSIYIDYYKYLVRIVCIISVINTIIFRIKYYNMHKNSQSDYFSLQNPNNIKILSLIGMNISGNTYYDISIMDNLPSTTRNSRESNGYIVTIYKLALTIQYIIA